MCDDGWDNIDAGVVCRQLGLSSSGLAVSFATFGRGTGTILLDEVSCTAGQSNIFECRHNGFENHDCSHSEDAGVRCGDVPSEYLYDITVPVAEWVFNLVVLHCYNIIKYNSTYH